MIINCEKLVVLYLLVTSSFAHYVSIVHFTNGAFVFFHPANPRACSLASLRSAKLQHPTQKPLTFIHFFPLHSLSTSSPCSSQPATFKQKDAPTLLPAAPCHSTSCYPCQGHSLHSRRLAHNAQA